MRFCSCGYLVINRASSPVARISPSEALKHPFFDTEVEVVSGIIGV